MHVLQNRNSAKLNAKHLGTAATNEPNAGMGFANASKAMITYQTTKPCVYVRIRRKQQEHDCMLTYADLRAYTSVFPDKTCFYQLSFNLFLGIYW